MLASGARLSVWFAVLICIGLASNMAFACSCVRGSLEGTYDRSENVFTALVTGGETTGERVGNSAKLKTFFTVTETFKGSIPFEYFSSHAGGSSCGISLQVGVEYLIFAPDTGKIGLCSGIVAVSGLPHEGEALGPKYVAALQAFKTGENDDLADPWHFLEYRGICRLSGRFPYANTRWPASIRVTYWSRMPDTVVLNPDKPDLKPGFTEMSISVPGRDDLTNYPLTLAVNGKRYSAQWAEGEYSRARYLINGEDVPDLIADMVGASAVSVTSVHPEHGEIDTEASLANAGESVEKMAQCINSREVSMGEP